jgi:cytochrome c oxidase subunit 3
MEIGTAEPIITKEKKRKRRRSGLTGGGGSNGKRGGGGNGGGGGGGDRPDDSDEQSRTGLIPNKSRIVTGFLLLIVMMTFGALIVAYVVLKTNGGAEWKPFALPIQVWISTVIILCSSAAYHFAKMDLDREYHQGAKKWLIVTAALGGTFISSQIIVWLELVQRGFYVSKNPYVGFFYILTAVHAAHVIGGIVALGAILLRAWNDTQFEPELQRRKDLAQAVGWYWHFMGFLWIVLFILLGFWR